MFKPIILYDIPGNVKMKAWSPNTWKVRYALNYKKLPCKTFWVEYPDIEPLCKLIGADPTKFDMDGQPVYTLPVIHDINTNTVVSESHRISEYLERTYPNSPKLFPEGSEGVQAAFQELFGQELLTAFPLLMLKMVFEETLRPASKPFFKETREATFMKNIEEFDEEADEQWMRYKTMFTKLASLYNKNGGRHFIQGDGLTFADIVVGAFFVWYRFIKGEDEHWKDMLKWDNGKWAELLEVLKPYEVVA